MYLHSFCSLFFFFKQKTAYEMRISDWSSDVCSSDLQYGVTEDELAELHGLFGDRLLLDPEIDARNDLDGLAAQITALDLTVTVSNVTAHLAGALGRPVWVLAPAGKSRFFYLMAQGEGTPWYPSMRIFRPEPEAGQAALEIGRAAGGARGGQCGE